MDQEQIIVIGGGAAGMMAALSARESGASVTLLEPNEKLGRKLYITGKGRCNLTNNSEPTVVLQNIPTNSRFLYSAVNQFPPRKVMEYFEQLGVPLKTERGGRVFPSSDKAADVIDALFFSLKRKGVKLTRKKATGFVWTEGKLRGVQTEKGEIFCKAVILATGGVSYPGTGSTGDGYAMAASVGHTLIPARASLVPLVAKGEDCAMMQGLSLRNVTLSVRGSGKKPLFEEQGELLFTHFGLSGPLALSASAHLRDFEKERYTARIDLKPALDEGKLEERLLREFSQQSNRDLHHVLEGLLPRLMIPVMLEKSGISGQTKAHSVTKAQRRQLLTLLKAFPVELAGTRPVEEAIITAGGVKTGEIDPKTMMSKKLAGLFFAGEIMDVDAYTGGFNLQIAWCTGRAAGQSAAAYCKEE